MQLYNKINEWKKHFIMLFVFFSLLFYFYTNTYNIYINFCLKKCVKKRINHESIQESNHRKQLEKSMIHEWYVNKTFISKQ